MSWLKEYFKTKLHNLYEVIVAVDILANAILCFLTNNKANTGETLSSAAYRAHRAYVVDKDKKYLLGHWCMNGINALFFWDTAKIKDRTMYHCEKAYHSYLRTGNSTIDTTALYEEVKAIEPDEVKALLIVDLIKKY